MISFLIPTLNFNCSKLVKILWYQAHALQAESHDDFQFEIIVSDDASDDMPTLSLLEQETSGQSGVRILRHDEPIALSCVEPFNRTCSHLRRSPSWRRAKSREA